MEITTDAVLHIFRYGTSQDKRALFDVLMENGPGKLGSKPIYDQMVSIMDTDTSPSGVVTAFSGMLSHYVERSNLMLNSHEPLLTQYSNKFKEEVEGDSRVGAALALAVYRYTVELLDDGQYFSESIDRSPKAILSHLARYAFNYVTALVNLGEFQEVIAFAGQAVADLTNREAKIIHNLRDQAVDYPSINFLAGIQVTQAKAYVQKNLLDKAEAVLQQIHMGDMDASYYLEFYSLRREVIQRRAAVHEDKAAGRTLSLNEQFGELRRLTMEFMPAQLKDSANSEFLNAIIEIFNIEAKLDLDTREGYLQMIEMWKQFRQLIITQEGIQVDSQTQELSDRIRLPGNIFMHNTPSDTEVRQAEAILQEELTWATQQGVTQSVNSALWSLYLCYRHLKQPNRAADYLQQLRLHLEDSRNLVQNYTRRGGAFTRFPHLFDVLCENLAKAGRTAELLDAIEGAKGRALGDALAATTQSLPAETSKHLYGLYEPLASALQQAGAHYLTFYVDEECTYAVLVTRSGQLHQPKEPISVGRKHLEQWTKTNLYDPKHWPLSKMVARLDIPQALAPLVTWLSPLIAEGVLAADDHVCYCPDDQLHLFPLQYIQLEGKNLVEWFSLSKIHGAAALLHLLSKEPSRPACSLNIEVPRLEERDDPAQQIKLELFREGSRRLQELVPGTILRDEKATLAALVQGKQYTNQLVHFTTHGVFSATLNPYETSGLLIADGGHLPKIHSADPNYNYSLEAKHLLSPKRLIDAALNFNGAHVTLQACVSGYSREGVGGDALGLEWAFMRCGTTSLLSTYWDVDIDYVLRFSQGFYRYWLQGGTTRGVAHRRAMLDLLSSSLPNTQPGPYY